jgi:uncharacterized protein (TIGR02996 family)
MGRDFTVRVRLPAHLRLVQSEIAATSTTDASQLLATLRAAPDDDEPRLVYADYLSERRDPRGELIIVQCRLARIAADDPERPTLEGRVRELILGSKLRERLRQPSLQPEDLDRGFLHSAWTNGTLDDETEAILANELVERLRVFTLEQQLATRLGGGAPWLARLRELEIDSGRDAVRASALAALAKLVDLRALRLRSSLDGDSIATLAAWPFRSLRRLVLDACGLQPAGVDTLAASPSLSSVEELTIVEHHSINDQRSDRAGRLAVALDRWLPKLPQLRFATVDRETGDRLTALAASDWRRAAAPDWVPQKQRKRVRSWERKHLK